MKSKLLLSRLLICAALFGFWLPESRSSSFSARAGAPQAQNSDRETHLVLLGALDPSNGPIRDSLKLKIFEGECKAMSQPLAPLPVTGAAAEKLTASLAPGKYCLVAEAPGYQKMSQTVNVSADTKDVVVKLACEQPDKVTQQCRTDYATKPKHEAMDSCRRAVQCNPEEADNRKRVAKLYYDDGNYTVALEFINQAIERDPADWDSFYVRAKIYMHLENFKDDLKSYKLASDDIETATKLCDDQSSDCADLHHVKGQILKQEALAQKAVECKLWEGAVRELGSAITVAQGQNTNQELLKELKEYKEDLANASDRATKAGCDLTQVLRTPR